MKQNSRIDIRINKIQKEWIKYASEVSGYKNLSQFIIDCSVNESIRIIEENNSILNTIEDKKIFLNAILNPPEENAKLKNAKLNYKKK